MSIPPDPWELRMMEEYKIENVAELRKLLSQPPHPKYLRRDEINANEHELERYLYNYRQRKRRLNLLWRVPTGAAMLIFIWGFLINIPMAILAGSSFLIDGIIHKNWRSFLVGTFCGGLCVALYKDWREACRWAWKITRSSEFWTGK